MLEDLWVLHFEKRFTATYMVALGVLAGFAIFSQVVGFFEFSQRDTAAHVLNVAARQRTLAQQFAKLAVSSQRCETEDAWKSWSTELTTTLNDWERIQAGLRSRDA